MKNLFNNQENLSKKHSLKFIIIFIFIALICFFLGIGFSVVFRVKKIESNLPLKNSIQEKLLFNNILLLNLNEVQQTILANYPHYRSIKIKKVFPDRLHISIEVEKVVAQLLNNGNYIMLSKDGKIIKQRQKETPFIPTIKYFQVLREYETKPGVYLKQQEINYALKLISKKKQFPIKFSTININKNNQLQIVENEDLPRITLSTRKQIDKNAIILHNILKSFDIKGIKPNEINLLFDIPSFTL
jgi:cell division septal protein FtsQ